MKAAAGSLPSYSGKVIHNAWQIGRGVLDCNNETAKKKTLRPKARVNPDGFMGSAPVVHTPKRGKGSYRRRKKHRRPLDN